MWFVRTRRAAVLAVITVVAGPDGFAKPKDEPAKSASGSEAGGTPKPEGVDKSEKAAKKDAESRDPKTSLRLWDSALCSRFCHGDHIGKEVGE